MDLLRAFRGKKDDPQSIVDQTKERASLLKNISRAIKEVQLHHASLSQGQTVKDCRATIQLCTSFESALRHGLKSNLFGQAGTFWPVALKISRKQAVEYINTLQFAQSDNGRARAWIRLAVNESSLESYISVLLHDVTLLSKYYEHYSFLRDEESADALQQLLTGLSQVNFNIGVDTASLEFEVAPSAIQPVVAYSGLPVGSNQDVAGGVYQSSASSSNSNSSKQLNIEGTADKKQPPSPSDGGIGSSDGDSGDYHSAHKKPASPSVGQPPPLPEDQLLGMQQHSEVAKKDSELQRSPSIPSPGQRFTAEQESPLPDKQPFVSERDGPQPSGGTSNQAMNLDSVDGNGSGVSYTDDFRRASNVAAVVIEEVEGGAMTDSSGSSAEVGLITMENIEGSTPESLVQEHLQLKGEIVGSEVFSFSPMDKPSDSGLLGIEEALYKELGVSLSSETMRGEEPKQAKGEAGSPSEQKKVASEEGSVSGKQDIRNGGMSMPEVVQMTGGPADPPALLSRTQQADSEGGKTTPLVPWSQVSVEQVVADEKKVEPTAANDGFLEAAVGNQAQVTMDNQSFLEPVTRNRSNCICSEDGKDLDHLEDYSESPSHVSVVTVAQPRLKQENKRCGIVGESYVGNLSEATILIGSHSPLGIDSTSGPSADVTGDSAADTHDIDLDLCMNSNYFSQELDIEKLEKLIQTIKEEIRYDENKEKKDRLIQYQFQLQQLKESGWVNTTLGHTLCSQASSQVLVKGYMCDGCGSQIRGMKRQWYRCSNCLLCVHQECMKTLSRPCLSAIKETKYTLELCPEEGLTSQRFRCKQCNKHLDPLAVDMRICDYDGFWYCNECHHGDTTIIPARVIHNWDFKHYKVCCRCTILLGQLYHKPLLSIKALNNKLYSYVDDLSAVETLRDGMCLMKKYIVQCRLAKDEGLCEKLDALLPANVGTEFYSLCDLVELQKGVLLKQVQESSTSFSTHIKECPICSGKGYYCMHCKADELLFPFDRNIECCTNCKTVSHRECASRSKECPNCIRLKQIAQRIK